MMISIAIMIASAAVAICVFAIMQPRRPPVLSGQRWVMPGLGSILVVETLGPGASFGTAQGKYINVRYRTSDGTCGYCTKDEIRGSGRLVRYNQKSARDKYIESILDAARNKKSDLSWEPYKPPPGWQKKYSEGPIIDADIVDLSDEAPNDYLSLSLRHSSHFPREQ